MKHDYSSYRIPAPIIKEPSTVVEDAAGDLLSTHQLVDTLIGDIEGIRDFGRGMVDRPERMQAEALIARANRLWALAEAISTRLKDSVILLYALAESRSTSSPSAFAQQHMQVIRAKDRYDAATTEQARINRDDEYLVEVDKLLAMRAPNADAMRVKATLIKEKFSGHEMPEDVLDILVADAEALEANR